jgi:hypothetical protein
MLCASLAKHTFVDVAMDFTHTPAAVHQILTPSIVLYSTERWMGAVRWRFAGCGLAGSLGRRSYPLSLYPSPHLLILVLPLSSCALPSRL